MKNLCVSSVVLLYLYEDLYFNFIHRYGNILITDMAILIIFYCRKSYLSGLSRFRQKPSWLTFWDQIHVDWNLTALKIVTDFYVTIDIAFAVGVCGFLWMCVLKTAMLSYCSFCKQEKLPITFQSCVMTKECQVSEWSEWTPCSKTCFDMTTPKGNRTRSRTIKQLPVGSESECPQLEEAEQCVSQGDGVAPCIT